MARWIHRLGEEVVDNPVNLAVDKGVNNVMVSLTISARDVTELASASVVP
jgi:hypothetical protein